MDIPRPSSPGSDSEEDEPPQPVISPQLTGTVKLFSLERGYGFIVGDHGEDVYVTRMHIEKPKGLLRSGDRVVYNIAKGDRGPHAVKVRKLNADGRVASDEGTRSEQANATVDAIISKAREMTLQAVDTGTIHPALAKKIAAVAGLEGGESEEDEDPVEVEARRKRALKRMLEQQAAARDLALAKQRREERQREAEERAAAFRTPTPPPVPEPLIPVGASSLLAETSIDVVRGIVSRRPQVDSNPTNSPLALRDWADPGMDSIIRDAAAHALTSQSDAMDDVVAAAVAAATAALPDPSGTVTPPMPPPHPSAFGKHGHVEGQVRASSRASASSASTSPMLAIPNTQAEVEAEIISVAGIIRNHEQELARQRRRIDALKMARASMIAACAAMEQTRLNLIVHSVVNPRP